MNIYHEDMNEFQVQHQLGHICHNMKCTNAHLRRLRVILCANDEGYISMLVKSAHINNLVVQQLQRKGRV